MSVAQIAAAPIAPKRGTAIRIPGTTRSTATIFMRIARDTHPCASCRWYGIIISEFSRVPNTRKAMIGATATDSLASPVQISSRGSANAIRVIATDPATTATNWEAWW